jgi:ribonuclease T2
MRRIASKLVLASLMVGCVRTAPAPSEPAPVARAAPELVAREFNLRPVEGAPTPSARAVTGGPDAGPGVAADFGLYVLALSWEPNFCCGHSTRDECKTLQGSFGATHLTIHGLWPNYTDEQAKNNPPPAWPQYCAPYGSCNTKDAPSGCFPVASTIPPDMKTYGPGYVSDKNFLADHEWPKHGSCTGLDSGTYFSAAISSLLSLPGDQGTPDVLGKNVGKSVATTDLRAAFGTPESVMLSCDESCNLVQVSICLTNDSSGKPKDRTACPTNATKSPYDNGCFTRQCQTVNIQAVDQCSSGGGGNTGGGTTGGGSTCGTNGKGPSCTDDSTCVSQKYLRCAKSGCCTTQPR